MIKNYSKRDSPVLPGYLKASVKHKKFSDIGSVVLPVAPQPIKENQMDEERLAHTKWN